MRVVFDLEGKQISVEGDEPELVELLRLVRDIAPQLPQIQISVQGTAGKSQPLGNGQKPEQPAGPLAQTGQSMRQFARSLALSNAAERIAAVAYYAKRFEGKLTFSPKEVEGWFAVCGFPMPSQIAVAVFDSKRKYGFTENATRGEWKLSTSGENFIIGKIDERDQEPSSK